MKVKATKVTVLSALEYITEGKVYDVQVCYGGVGWIVDDVGDSILINFRGYEECAHGVKWEIVE